MQTSGDKRKEKLNSDVKRKGQKAEKETECRRKTSGGKMHKKKTECRRETSSDKRVKRNHCGRETSGD